VISVGIINPGLEFIILVKFVEFLCLVDYQGKEANGYKAE
jgi:hypothetical protein